MRLKRVIDLAIAFPMLLLLAPVILLIGVLVAASSRGPVVIRQLRLGKRGKRFAMLKFRTMVVDAEPDGTPMWAHDRDPRVTRVGKVLRALHLDEVPQLMNVVVGDMSLVGPRPERPELSNAIACEVPGWNERLAVVPGITGLAQIRQGYVASVEDSRIKLEHDLEYIARQSTLFDLRIVFLTLALPLKRAFQHLGGNKASGAGARV